MSVPLRVLKAAVRRTKDAVQEAMNVVELYVVDTGAGENRDKNLQREKLAVIRRDLDIDKEYDKSGYIRYEIVRHHSICLHTIYLERSLGPVFLVDESIMVNPRAHATRQEAVEDFVNRIQTLDENI